MERRRSDVEPGLASDMGGKEPEDGEGKCTSCKGTQLTGLEKDRPPPTPPPNSGEDLIGFATVLPNRQLPM